MAGWGAQDVDGFAGEHGVEDAGERGVAIPDQEPELSSTIAGQHGSIGQTWPGASDLAAQHVDLVVENQEFDVVARVPAPVSKPGITDGHNPVPHKGRLSP